MSSRRARVTEGLGIWLIVVLAMGSLHRVDGPTLEVSLSDAIWPATLISLEAPPDVGIIHTSRSTALMGHF